MTIIAGKSLTARSTKYASTAPAMMFSHNEGEASVTVQAISHVVIRLPLGEIIHIVRPVKHFGPHSRLTTDIYTPKKKDLSVQKQSN